MGTVNRAAIVLAPGEGRSGELLHAAGDIAVTKLTGRDTGVKYCVAEEISSAAGRPVVARVWSMPLRFPCPGCA